MGTTDRLRLHVGSGSKYFPGFVNIDRYAARADVHCDCLKLSYEDHQVDELYAIHLLEHFHRLNAEIALTEWLRVLKHGGKLVLELPCLDKIVTHLAAKEKNIRLTLYGLYGDPHETKPGMEHKWAWSIEEIEVVLQELGYRDVQVMEPKFHIPARDMRVEALKP